MSSSGHYHLVWKSNTDSIRNNPATMNVFEFQYKSRDTFEKKPQVSSVS